MASENPQKTETSNGVKTRMMLQQCLSAKLQIQPESEGKEADHVEIGRGLIIYLCFMKGSTEEMVDRMVKSVLNVRLSESESGKLISILDLPGDVLIIPQATLGGNMKGKCMQYHRNIAKDEGLHLFTRFTNILRNTVRKQNTDCVVHNGTYGHRQVLSTVTNGPFSHLLEFS